MDVPRGSCSSPHFDDFDNLLCVVAGRKTVVVMDFGYIGSMGTPLSAGTDGYNHSRHAGGRSIVHSWSSSRCTASAKRTATTSSRNVSARLPSTVATLERRGVHFCWMSSVLTANWNISAPGMRCTFRKVLARRRVRAWDGGCELLVAEFIFARARM